MNGFNVPLTDRDRNFWAALCILPACYFVLSWILRADGGPFWMWHIVDPSYFYLFDSLNLVNLTTPGHPYHPGTTVQVLGALVLKAAYLTSNSEEITQAVLADPESHLRLISTAIILLNTSALLLSGAVAYAVTRHPVLALVMQLGPFLSMVTLKTAYHVKPEPLLILTMLALGMVTLLALAPGVLEKHRWRFAVAFGLVAGFGVATKITSAPIFLLPVFLLGGFRHLAIYGVTSLLSLILFTLPAIGAYDLFFAWMAKVSAGSGAYGGGEQTVIDFARYPKNVIGIFSRPILHLPFLLSLIALGLAWRRRRRGLPVPGAECRATAGFCLAVLAQVLLVAKQPTAFYMIPAYMAGALGIVLLHRLVTGLGMGGEKLRSRCGWAFSLAIGILAISQVNSILRLDRELEDKFQAALTVENANFANCARIYFFPAASQSFALALGDWWTGSQFAASLAGERPANDFWFEQNIREFRDWKGPRSLPDVLESFPCAFFRGGHPGPISTYIKETVPEIEYEVTCSTRNERIFTIGVNCQGRIKKPAGDLGNR